MSGKVSKYTNLFASGQEAVTGSKTVTAKSLGLKKIVKMLPSLASATAPSSSSVTAVVSADGSSATLYTWKPTSSSVTTLIAGTAAINVDYVAFGY